MESVFVIVGGVLISCYSEAAHLEVPEGVIQIRDYAFSRCENMQSITLPEGLIKIGNFAFFNCHELQNLRLPLSLRRVGKAAFKGCKGLADAKGLVVINHMVHDYCGEDPNVVIPEGVTTIGYEAFFLNKRVQTVTLPRAVRYISSCAFDGCDDLVLRVFPGSRAEAYARAKGIPFALIR